MTKIDEVTRAILSDLESFKKKWDERARKDHPEMTDEQLRAAWDQIVHQFGFG
jgi:hypothetical protein